MNHTRTNPARALSARISGLEVKICGVRDVRGALACDRAGADWAGINRVAGGKRYIDQSKLSDVLAALGAVRPVLVLRDLDLRAIEAEVQASGVTTVQLHGDELPDLGAALRQRGIAVIKALDPGQRADAALVQAWARVAQRFVLDGREAGSGRTWAWRALDLQGGCLAGVPVWLAGGIGVANVGAAIAEVRPAGVDVASGVEASAAQDPSTIAAFVATARDAQALIHATGSHKPCN